MSSFDYCLRKRFVAMQFLRFLMTPSIRRRGAHKSGHRSARVFAIVQTFLKGLEFSGDDIIWWPLGKQRQIVADPRGNFGQPTVALVARWYEVQPEELRDAVEFARSLAKAA
jgi:hypothetical protein